MDEEDLLTVTAQRIPCKGGDEFDAFSRWREVLNWKPGELKAIKRSYNRRVRRSVRRELKLKGIS